MGPGPPARLPARGRLRQPAGRQGPAPAHPPSPPGHALPPTPTPSLLPQSRTDDRAAPSEDDGASYQLDMMRCLREVNADNNTVGWYQSTSLGAFQTAELADTFAAYASTIRRAVCIVVDPDAARGGGRRPCFFSYLRVNQSERERERERGTTKNKQKGSLVFSNLFRRRPLRPQSRQAQGLVRHRAQDRRQRRRPRGRRPQGRESLVEGRFRRDPGLGAQLAACRGARSLDPPRRQRGGHARGGGCDGLSRCHGRRCGGSGGCRGVRLVGGCDSRLGDDRRRDRCGGNAARRGRRRGRRG